MLTQNQTGAAKCGIDDIDQLREEVAQITTSASTAASRRSALYRWWRFLWHQGIDMSGFNDAAKDLLTFSDSVPEGWQAIDRGYSQLEKIARNPHLIPEIKGNPSKSSSKTDWPRYHGIDGSQTGYSPDSGPSQGEIAWRFPKGYSWSARPVLENGKVYVPGAGIDVVCFCLDEISGKVLWRGRQYGTDFYQTHGSRWDPTVTEKFICIRTGFFQENTLIFDKNSGQDILVRGRERNVPFFQDSVDKTHEEVRTKDGFDPEIGTLVTFSPDRKTVIVQRSEDCMEIHRQSFDHYLAGEPVLDGTLLYIALQNSMVQCIDLALNDSVWAHSAGTLLRGPVSLCKHLLLVGSEDNRLVAMNPRDGTIFWTFEADEIENKAYQFFSGALEADGRIYLGAASGYIYCLDSTTGTQLWKYKVGDWIRARPVRIAGVIYCATLDSKVVALRDNGSKAEELWRSTLGSHGITADLVGNDNGILASGRDLILYSLSLKTGKVQWRHGILDGTWIQDRFISAEVIGGGFQSSPTVVESVLYIGGPDGFINALDVETGKEIWRFETGGMVSATPIVADGSVFVGQSFGCGEFYRLDKDTGEPIWSSVEFGPVWVSAAYNDNRLFVGGKDGRMHCVDPLNGKILWTHDAGKSLPSSGSLFGIYSNTAADENNIYFGSWAGEYVALNQKSGSVIWKTKTCDDNRVDGKPDSAAPVLWKNHLYVQKLVESIVAINIHSGEIDWEWRVPEDRFQNGTAAAHENRIYFSASLGREILPYESSLYAFTDVENGGKYQWECKGAGGLTSPVLTDDKVVFGSTASVFLTCIDSENGSVIWRLYTGGVMEETTPALYGKLFFAQCRNGYLYAIQ